MLYFGNNLQLSSELKVLKTNKELTSTKHGKKSVTGKLIGTETKLSSKKWRLCVQFLMNKALHSQA